MPKNLKRYYGRGDLHFLTFSCYRRWPLLGSARARNLFLRVLGKIRERYKFRLVGYVVMPNHVHLLISEPPKATPSEVLKVLKQCVSRDLRKRKRRAPAQQLRLAFPRNDGSLPRFWQPRFYDFNVWKQEEARRKTGVHACESGDKKSGRSSQGLAMEQLVVLCQRRRSPENRSGVKTKVKNPTRKPGVMGHPTVETHDLRATRPNPVKRGLVRNPGAWMWSSFLFYEKEEPGWVPIDPVD